MKPIIRRILALLLAAAGNTSPLPGATVAYWEFDAYGNGSTAAAVGGPAMDLRSAGAGADFARLEEPALSPLPSPDGTVGFVGDARANAACLRSPGNAIENRYLETAPGTNLLRLHDRAWTVEGWIRCHGDEPDGFGDVILTTRDEPLWCGVTLLVLAPHRAGEGRRLHAYFEVKANAAEDPAAVFSVSTAEVLQPGRWHHIALVWNGRGEHPPTASLLVDGTGAARAEAPRTFDAAAADRYTLDCLRLGARKGSEKNSFAGDMDEFRISDTALQPMDMLLFPERTGPLPRVCQVAAPRRLHPRTPRAGDVLMRTLRWYPAATGDRLSTLQAMDAFHVTGLVWSYIHDPEVIAQVRANGRFFQGAVTNSLSTMRDLLGLPGKADDAETREFIARYGCQSLDGSPNEQPWKRHWPNPFSRASGCCSNPDFEALYVQALMTYTDAGAAMIQRDEGDGNASRPHYGGCFCDHCMRGFRDTLARTLPQQELEALGIADIRTFDYRQHLREADAPVGDAFARWDGGELQRLFRDYQHQVSAGFMQRTRRALDRAAGSPVAMSCNNGVREFGEVMRQFDWFFGELARSHATPTDLHRTATLAAALDRLQIVTMPKKGGHSTYDTPGGWEQHTRQTIATSYAVGGICMAPW
ncbi:MAG: LamG domain-containing protein, partial [Lentisphaeria bacterium]|nr:LamG domain-containing protein [Lentisphaeria bacterium]